MTKLPKDAFMLVSYLNTRLRDYDGTLEELCSTLDIDKNEICARLSEAGFEYDKETGRFG